MATRPPKAHFSSQALRAQWTHGERSDAIHHGQLCRGSTQSFCVDQALVGFHGGAVRFHGDSLKGKLQTLRERPKNAEW